MKLSSKAVILLLFFNLGAVSISYADAICKDGSRSESSGSGTCSWHGGVLNWLPKTGSSSSYSRDTYYDNSDNGVDPCKRRKYRESKKECETRVRLSRERSVKYLQQLSPSLGESRKDVLSREWWDKNLRELEELSECYQQYGVYNCPK